MKGVLLHLVGSLILKKDAFQTWNLVVIVKSCSVQEIIRRLLIHPSEDFTGDEIGSHVSGNLHGDAITGHEPSVTLGRKITLA